MGASRFVTVLDRELHFTEWGQRVPGQPSVVCWHGLMRTCRDFDPLAAALSAIGYHVLCPDTIGRGLSEWSSNPSEEYNVFFYAELAKALLDVLGIEQVYWFGTSMGGMIGYMGIGAGTLSSVIKKLVLNDIGPALCSAAIERILTYGTKPTTADTVLEMEATLQRTYAGFGIDEPELLRHLVEGGIRRCDDGRWARDYDPKVVDALHHGAYTGKAGFDDPWGLYDRVECPVLTIRGSDSDLFSEETLAEMTQRGPRTKSVVVEGLGHAPAMNTEAQIQHVVAFFQSTSA